MPGAMPLSLPFERASGPGREVLAANRCRPPALFGPVSPGQFGGGLPVGFSEGMLGVQPGGLFQVPDCFRVPAQLHSGHPPLVPGLGVPRVKGNGPVEIPDRFFAPVQAGQGYPPVQAGHGIAGPQGDDPAEVMDRRLGLILVQMGHAPVEQGVGVVRVQFNGPAEVLNCQAGLVQTGVGAGPPVVGVGVVREQVDQPVEVPDGLFELLALERAKALAVRAPVLSGSISSTAPKSSTALS